MRASARAPPSYSFDGKGKRARTWTASEKAAGFLRRPFFTPMLRYGLPRDPPGGIEFGLPFVRAMRIDGDFHAAYRVLEERMKALAEADGDVFLPNPEPEGPVPYVLIGMEPSLGRWARSADQARSKVTSGFRNFLPSDEVALLHFCIRRYLCRPAERYHITDLSKGAMLVDRAGLARVQRYERWYELLEEEIDLVATPEARIVAVGGAVSEQLKRQGFRRLFTPIMHYSSQAGLARSAGIVGREDRFQAFRDSVSPDDVSAAAKDVLTSARVPANICDETLSRLKRFPLTPSRQQLIFNYKEAFESLVG